MLRVFFFVFTKSFQRRKTNNKPRDATTAAGDTAAESVRNLIKKNPKYSKRINYDALKDLFVDGGDFPSSKMNIVEDESGDIFTMDDKSDGEGMSTLNVIVEEEPGTVMTKPLLEGVGGDINNHLADDIYDDGSDDDKEAEVLGWEDAYEQEV